MLTLETFPNGAYTHVNHLDIAVSQTSNPTGGWNIYRIDVTNDGIAQPSASNPCPVLGDYPHIGADANGFYVTTNAYPWGGNGFNGAQLYAFSKAQLAAGAASVTMQHIDTFGMVNVPSDAGIDSAGLHCVAGPVAWNHVVQPQQRRHRILHELERSRRSDAPCRGHGRHL